MTTSTPVPIPPGEQPLEPEAKDAVNPDTTTAPAAAPVTPPAIAQAKPPEPEPEVVVEVQDETYVQEKDIFMPLQFPKRSKPSPKPLTPEEMAEAAVTQMATKYQKITCHDEELAKAITVMELLGDRMPRSAASPLVEKVMNKLLGNLLMDCSGIACLAEKVRKYQPELFDQHVNNLMQEGACLSLLLQPRAAKHFTNLAAIIHGKFMADLELTTAADILLLDSAINQLTTAMLMRQNTIQSAFSIDQVKDELESRKWLTLALEYEKNSQQILTQLQRRKASHIAPLHVHAAGSAAVQVNVGEQKTVAGTGAK